MKNVMYSGIRSFIKGLLEHSQSGTIAKWVDCRLLTSVYVNSKFTIGGEELFIEKGSELLLKLHSAAKAKKLTEAEGKVVANYLVQINWKFDTLRSAFYLEVLEQSDLTNTPENNKIQHNNSGSSVEPALQTDESTVQKDSNIKDEVPVIKKSGRPPSKKQPV